MNTISSVKRAPVARDLKDWSRWHTYRFHLKIFNPGTGRTKHRAVEVFTPFRESAQVGAGPLPGEDVHEVKSRGFDLMSRLLQPFLPKRLSIAELAAFFETMAVGMDRTRDTGASLEAAARVAKTPLMRGHIAALRHLVARGYTLADAMAALPGFSGMHVAITEAGTRTEGLAQNYEELAKRLQSSANLIRKLIGGLIYPAVMLLSTLAITLYIEIAVLPKFKGMFSQLGADMPFITKTMMNFGTIAQDHWVTAIMVGVPFLLASALLLRRLVKTEFSDRMAMYIPVFNKVIAKLSLHRSLEVYAMISEAGLDSRQIYQLAGEAADNFVVKRFFEAVYARISTGATPEAAMAREWPRLGPEGVVLAARVSIGNKSGKTEELIRTLAADYKESAEATLAVLPQLISVPLWLVMGSILMPAVLALSLPMPTLIAKQLQIMSHQ